MQDALRFRQTGGEAIDEREDIRKKRGGFAGVLGGWLKDNYSRRIYLTDFAQQFQERSIATIPQNMITGCLAVWGGQLLEIRNGLGNGDSRVALHLHAQVSRLEDLPGAHRLGLLVSQAGGIDAEGMEFGEEGGHILPNAGDDAKMLSPYAAASQGVQPGTAGHAEMDLLTPGNDVVNEDVGDADDEISHAA